VFAPDPALDLSAVLGADTGEDVPAAVRAVLRCLPGTAVCVMDRTLRLHLAEGPLAVELGFTTETVAGRHLDDVLPSWLARALRPHLEAACDGERRVVELHHPPLGRTHGHLAAPVTGPRGEVRGVAVLTTDVTERREREDRERAAAAELERRLAQTAALARLGEHALREPCPSAVMEAAVAAVVDSLGVADAAILERQGEALVLRTGRARPQDTVAELGVAIGDPAAAWGELHAYAPVPRAFGEADHDLLQAVAHIVGTTLERRRTEEAAAHDALHDPLTGLPNRTLLTDRLGQALRRRGRGGPRVAVLFLNLDGFKVVNDSLGHAAGDALLALVGPRLGAALRTGDTVARFGGDSFVVVCEDVAGEAQVHRLADRIAAAFAEPFVVGDEELFVSATTGVVLATGGERPEDLLRDADAAMYRAKEAGRRYEIFDPQVRERAVARLRTESEQRRAIAQDELRVHFQPYWSLPGRRLAGFEALVRWEHPERGLVPPGDFIPIAETSGLIVPIGTWVLRESCRLMAAWKRDRPETAGLQLRVNLSARQVEHPGLIHEVGAALRDHGLPADVLGLEITEGLLLQDSDTVAATLRGLKELGVGLVLDDFGTGYSSLSYLKRFPLDQLKIDRAFIGGLEEREEDRAIVQAIVGMAGALGLAVIPEGVETEEQLLALVELGCEFAQGFLLGRPMRPEDAEALL
jgi:diguanylate cyclase (GGDEF)-like protein